VALLLLLVSCSTAIPATDLCRGYSSSCELCASFQGCYWCGQANATTACVENFGTIRSECPLLILTSALCKTNGLSFTPPPLDGTWRASVATISATVRTKMVSTLNIFFFFFFFLPFLSFVPSHPYSRLF
jgi:hypothetical protein